MSEDTQVTEDEAELALLALGEPLEWTYPLDDRADIFGAAVGPARYGYGSVRDKPLFFAMYCPDVANFLASYRAGQPNWIKREYESIAAAKAACELHHATGCWE